MPAEARIGSALANVVTGLRLLLILPIAHLIVAERSGMALALLLLAALSDALDGRLARRFGTTVLGSWLDVTADRLLIAAVVAALFWSEALPGWITATLVIRESLVAGGALLAYAPARPMAPLIIGKAYTGAAFLLLVAAVAAQGGWLPAPFVDALGAVVVVTAIASLMAYARRLAR